MKYGGNLGIFFLAILIVLSSMIAGCSSDETSPTLVASSTPTSVESDAIIPILPSWTGNTVVQTQFGTVKGFEDESDTFVWKAIPFAKPPMGELRWKAPRDPESWEGILEADSFCEWCPQYEPIGLEDVWGNEDCLYLNVWRPQTEETDLPVYVWIHGGGNTIGAATQTPTYMGSTLANKSNMVFVSMNYRLGPFGWFTHPSLESGDPLDDSGNYGTLDIIKSLEWIQKNIEAFGGDPDRVLVTGESAGAMNVFSLLMSPVAEGLFSTALAQSGMQVTIDVEEGEKSAQSATLQALINDGTAANETGAKSYIESLTDEQIQSYLYSKTPAEVLACYEQRERGYGMIDSPAIFNDGAVIVSDGAESFANGTYPVKVPLMIGSTREELKMFLFSHEELVADEELYQTVTSYGSNLWKVGACDEVARKMSLHADQPEIYAYHFRWGAYRDDGSSPIPAPFDLKVGSAHSLDNSFFLGNPSFNVFMTNWVFTEENRPGREALTDAMMAYTAQFASTGNPNTDGSDLPEWKHWENGGNNPKQLILDADLNDAKIAMSTEEITSQGVIDTMKVEVSEPLFSRAIKFILDDWIVSFLLEDVDVDYTPQSAIESTSTPAESSLTPEPTELSGTITSTSTYSVHYENEGVTQDSVWTITRTGEETIEGVDCYTTDISFDKDLERVRYVEMLSNDIPLTVTNMASSVDKTTSQPLQAISESTAMGFAATATTVFTYDGDYGAPFSEGKTWSYEMVSTPSMGPVMTSNWTAEVVGTESITVPAGTFDCYKIVASNDSDGTNTEWWTTIEYMDVMVKTSDEANWTGTETRELVSFVTE